MTSPADERPDDTTIVVIGPDGSPIGTVAPGSDMTPMSARGDDDDEGVGPLIAQPAKVMRVGSMIKQLLDEVKSAPLDEASRARLRDIHARSIVELESGLAPELVDELERLSLPFDDGVVPSEAELRIAQAQLVGWLEGLFHGIQTAMFAQQMAARAQFEELRRRAIPAGGSTGPGDQLPDGGHLGGGHGDGRPGNYL